MGFQLIFSVNDGSAEPASSEHRLHGFHRAFAAVRASGYIEPGHPQKPILPGLGLLFLRLPGRLDPSSFLACSIFSLRPRLASMP